jgi:NitT/TauT family transport system substrate-binding protein
MKDDGWWSGVLPMVDLNIFKEKRMEKALKQSGMFAALRMVSVLTIILIAVGLGTGNSLAADKNTPRLYLGYVFTTHHTPLIVAANRGEAFKTEGAYFKPMVERQKYELMDRTGKSLAVINFIVSKSGSETATLFAQGRMDMGLASSTAFISGIDKGTAMKILCPLHVDGMGMVFPKESTLSGWQDVHNYIKTVGHPVKIGYHSPTSAPRIVFEGALYKAGLKITEDVNDASADVLLVDLKSTANLIPALVSKQVDCWVGPAPHPSVAESKNVGHVALDSRELPPVGQWHDFPCCVMGASQSLIESHPEVVQAMTRLMTASANWCNANKHRAAQITAQWIGVPATAIERSTIIYTTNPNANWMRGEATFMEILNRMNKLKGRFKGKSLQEVEADIYDFRFVNAVLNKS